MIKVTQQDGVVVWIASDDIRYIFPEGKYSCIMFKGDSWVLKVTESVEQILKLPKWMIEHDI